LQPFTERAIEIIKSIPPGRVMTYGQIARLAGNPFGARQVSWLLHSMSRVHKLPWHRIINAKGEISYTGSEQREMLEMEGVIFTKNGKVDLHTYQWLPELTRTLEEE